ncbi:MAG: SAM-dependent chlorinase/fluorinase [Deltaproteobacteria bacterium]|nr:SAM-dependent chlorinase/fluorinase [Deltaproteobacteria bacterium]
MLVIALLTDFGLADPWVGVMKGVIAGIAPGVPVVDLSHGVPAQDVRTAAIHLDAAWRYFPAGTVFLCVVDPGVGTARRPIVARCEGRLFVAPDNGLLGLLPGPEVRLVTAPWGLPKPSRTFHGRDVFAPVAARLASGTAFEEAGPVVADHARLSLPEPDGDRGEVIHVDGFGNLLTNLPGRDAGVVEVAGHDAPVVHTYGAVPTGALLAHTGSTGRLEVGLRDGSAATRLRVGVGARVHWRG